MLNTAADSPAKATQGVVNQAPPLIDYNLFATDRVLSEGLDREGAGWARPWLEDFGCRTGSEEAIRWGFQANENTPALRTHDRFGRRIDELEFHPAWHELMRLSIENGLASLPWDEALQNAHNGSPRQRVSPGAGGRGALSAGKGAHVARSALMFLAAQNEAGHTCPVSMTCSAVPVLLQQPDVAREWTPRVLAARYDARYRPASEKSGALIGMAMTEKQGGSDVRANTSVAQPAGAGEYLLTGHKWFCSAPMSDAFLVLAQAPGGLTCFLLPRWTPDGERNAFHIQRLKSKLGNRSNASGEVEFEGAWAQRVGEEGRGVATIIEMVQHTRLDCVMGTAALMRQALVQAIHHARHRSAFGRLLIDQPLMQNVLADLALESEAATILMLRLARAFDARHSDPRERGMARLATAVGKYWVSKCGPAHVGEALECLGGNGYVEECVVPRLYREAPVNSVWEGSGNVICLDILRALRKDPEAASGLVDEISLARGVDRRFDAFADQVESDLRQAASEVEARRLAERLALALEASLLIRHSIPAVAGAFCATRLAGDGGRALGTLPAQVDFRAILERAF